MSIKVNVGLRVKPLPKLELRATNAGEMCSNLGASNEDVAVAQQGFQRGLFERVIIYGTNEQGHAIDRHEFGVAAAGDDNDLVSIDANDATSFIERTDAGAATGISLCYARFVSLGLHPTIHFRYRPEIASDPHLRARYNAELGLVEREPVPTADGYVIDTVQLTPAKDRGQVFRFGRGRKVR